MASVEELEAAISQQGALVKTLKTAKGDKAEIDAAVAKLLELKKAITVLAPEHPQAIVAKKAKEAKSAAPAGPSKKDLRLLARAKAVEDAEAKAAAEATDSADVFGDVEIVMSKSLSDRNWLHISSLEAPLASGKPTWVRGRVHTVRGKGSLAFVVLRQGCFTVQGVASAHEGGCPKAMLTYLAKLPNESIVDVEATITLANVSSCTQSCVELSLLKVFCVSKATPDLPFQVVDASRNENMKEEGLVTVGLDTRLNHRVIDLRTPANQAIMRIRSRISLLFATHLDSKGFVGVNSPKLLGGSSEGGSSVFRLQYFGKDCCLAQSPQLYKQMLTACSDFERVYEIGPVFRAEDSNTRRHLCEFTGLDFEMAIFEHYYEVLDVFGELFVHIFESLQRDLERELAIIGNVYPFQPFKFLKHTLRITFAEGIALLRGAGVTEEMQGEFDDLSTVNEKTLGNIVLEKFETDFFIMDKYPLSIRPFYTMPDPETYPSQPPAKQLSNSFDVFMRGQEICSGAQRVHDHKLLMERVNYCHVHAGGPAPESIAGYTDSFKYGVFPHGGGGVGLERVAMLFLDLTNIRKTSCFPRDPGRLTP